MNIQQYPSDHSAEVAVLASVLERGDLFDSVSFLSPKDFYYRPHAMAWELIIAEHGKGNPIDPYVIGDKFTEDMGGFAYFADIAKTHATPANIIAYARNLLEASVKRDAIKQYVEAINELQKPQVSAVGEIARVESEVSNSISRMAISDKLTVEDLIEQSLGMMETTLASTRTGLSTGIPEIDERLGYNLMAFGEITALGALSKNGKTLFANSIIAKADLKDDEVALVFSIEMPAVGMFNAIVSAMSGVPSNFYARQRYYQTTYPERYDEWMGRWGAAVQELNSSGRVIIDDKKDVTMNYIISEIRKQHSLLLNKGKKLKLVVIDHMHRVSYDTSKEPMTYAMGSAARMLKNTLADLEIAGLALCQLKEDCVGRNPTAFDILDTSRLRHEIQCFIGTRIFREDGATYFGVFSDAHRYADHETAFHPAYVRLAAGVIKSLAPNEAHWTPSPDAN